MLTGTPATLELGIDPSRTQERAMVEGLVSQAAFEQLMGSFQDAASLRAFATQARHMLETSGGLGFLQRAAALAMLEDMERQADRIAGGQQPSGAPAQAGSA